MNLSRFPKRRLENILCVLAMLLLIAIMPVSAQSTSASEISYSFGESIAFGLDTKLDNPLADCVLFFGRVGSPLVRRVYPDFQPIREQTLSYVEELVVGQYAPGTEFRVWWELTDATGQVLNTPIETFVYNDNSQDWALLQGEGIDLYWYGDEDNAQEILDAAEAALVRLADQMSVSAPGTVNIYTYQSSRDMASALSVRAEGYDEYVITLGVAVDEDTLLLLGTHDGAMLTVAHELSHIIVGQMMPSAFANMPSWLDEGLAMYAEEELPVSNQNALDAAVEDDALLSLRSMTTYSGDSSLVDLYYGEAWSVVDFMVSSYGQDALCDLLAELNTGINQDEALQNVIGVDLDGLEDAWRASLGLEPRTDTARATSEILIAALPCA